MQDRNRAKVTPNHSMTPLYRIHSVHSVAAYKKDDGVRGGLVEECRTPEREVRGLNPKAAV